ncbi:hypothetical protein Pmani_040234, partial [Petrolisthes manimaculis]
MKSKEQLNKNIMPLKFGPQTDA